MAQPPGLAAPFPLTTEADWRKAAGASASRTATSDDGVATAAIYPRRADAAPLVAAGGWRTVQRLTGATAEAVAREAAEAIAGGGAGIEIVFDASIHPLASRLPVATARGVASALGELQARDVAVRLDAGTDTAALAAAFTTTPGLILAHDPVAALAAGRGSRDVPAVISAAARTLDGGAATFAIADGRIWHAAGATDVQELAAALATVVALLRHAGIDPAPAFGGIGVALAADVNPFATIAKFRAARLLLLRLAELLGTDAAPAIHAETAWRAMSSREPRMNALRATTGALAAAVAGAGSITVLPADAPRRTSDAGAARLARNTLSILATEARLAAVADPGAGSGAIEAMTVALAKAAWEKFTALEAAGGILAAIAAGSIQREVAVARSARLGRVSRSEAPIIGVNVHVDGVAAAVASSFADGADRRLTFTRLAEPFEAAVVTPGAAR